MNDEWASRRKHLYLLVVVLFLTVASSFVFWRFWYEAPSCFDGKKNGDEMGVDCGGSCTLLCKAGVLAPVSRWDPRLFEVTPGVWSVLTYVENQNIQAMATYAPYTFHIYDETNKLILTREGATILPSHKTVGIFEGNLTFESGLKPKRAVFEFNDGLVWTNEEDQDVKLEINHSPLLRLESTPRVEAKVSNKGPKRLKNIELVVAVFDGADNAIAASRTFIEQLDRNEAVDVFFTWPRPFNLGSKMCEQPANVALLLDRSGSMASLGTKPPQPLTLAKEAASSFVSSLTSADKVSVVSFATTPSDPIDLNLNSDISLALNTLNNINIATSSTQYTNIFGALSAGWQELVSARVTEGASKVMILLTDGVATAPRDPSGRTEAEDIKYAESKALEVATSAKADNILIYTIGLGTDINADFLKKVASEPANYYFAPEASKLKGIYSDISSAICEELPARVEITYKIFDDRI